MPKKYTADERERALRMLREQVNAGVSVKGSCRVVGDRLGISPETLRNWFHQAQVDSGNQPGVTTAESQQVRELKARVRRLEEDNAILKAAATFFAGELDPRNR